MSPLLFSLFLDLSSLGHLSYLNDRYLNHATGRFISQDPVKQFTSHYSYDAGHVIISSDPTGRMVHEELEEKDSIEEIVSSRLGAQSENIEHVSKLSSKSDFSFLEKKPIITRSIVTQPRMNYKDWGKWFARNKDGGNLISMRRSLEITAKDTVLMRQPYLTDDQLKQEILRVTDYQLKNYKRMKDKQYFGLSTDEEQLDIKRHESTLSRNTAENIEIIRELSIMRGRNNLARSDMASTDRDLYDATNYQLMNNELIFHYLKQK
ncbi:hypothetical protein bplSymb_SCF15802P001 [Bathymodiolus platifrons methanotrophic gill symbiont]|uniref:hypothetical protein n=1 Tax=Bathymodiolus platifrons methanotrophic gill symbiont TaxID=113268 RepID=UPI000B41ADD5|nr:hypothetical protein [Bathymodiolus platifrons methanotrophic gill symbiont]GAW87754.1 hypothetical protein bplSymb_SCF15802P001 [Bathymodiolus platifrons methanotrophic gill symbiont]GFO77444.1 hypothetical protein BPLS_P5897 [Bathymodiolus platifrons methanotrophic gill symbiont]